MRAKAISIITLLALCACQPRPVADLSPETQALINDHPERRFEQECWDAGHTDKSKAFYNCMGEHWTAWKKSNGLSVAEATTSRIQESEFEKDQKRWETALQQCNALFFSKKLKTNYERGKCMDSAHEKYLSSHFINKSAFNDWRTDALLIMVKLDKKEISTDESAVLAKRSMDRLLEAEGATVAQMRQQEAAREQQAYQYQMQQQQHQSAARSAALLGFLGSVQNTLRQNQPRPYVPPVRTQCSTFNGTMTCYTDR